MYFMLININRTKEQKAAVGKIIPDHIAWIKSGLDSGKIVQCGKWGETGGMCVIEAENLESADVYFSTDPLVKSGAYEIIIDQFFPDIDHPVYKK